MTECHASVGTAPIHIPRLACPCSSHFRSAVRSLARRSAEQDAYLQHPTVKLAAALYRLMTEIVPLNPDAPEYRLRGALKSYRRAKGKGLPPRYRVFWIFSTQAKAIIFLYVNDEDTLRKGRRHSAQRGLQE